jgi:hypothetical protein
VLALHIPLHLVGLVKLADTAFATVWKEKIAYCIAFSVDGATDVTRRYVRNFERDGRDRARVSEEVLLYIIYEIRRIRREGMDNEQKSRLLREDAHEERELTSYIAKSLVDEMAENSYVASDLSNTAKHLYRGTTGMLLSEAVMGEILISWMSLARVESTTLTAEGGDRRDPA